MEFCVFTVMLPDLTPEEAAPLLKKYGYKGAEWRFKHIPDDMHSQSPSYWGNNRCTFDLTIEEAQRAKSIANAHDLAIPGLGTYINVGDVEAVKNAMTLAQACEAAQVRVGVGSMENGVSYAQAFERATDFLSKVETLAKQMDIKALVEIHHNTITPSASLAHRLVSQFNPAHIGVIHDAGNMIHEGFEHYRLGLELLGPYLAHVHVKNARFTRPDGGGIWSGDWSPLEDGIVNWNSLFSALKSVGYDDWIGVEDFSGARPSEEALKFNIEFLKSQWDKAH